MSAELIPFPTGADQLIDWTLATCASPHTRRMYRTQLRQFIASGLPLNREGVAAYLQSLRDSGRGSATLTSVVAAIRKLVREAQIRGLMSESEVRQIETVSPGKQYRTRRGLWLTAGQLKELLALPDDTYWGRRDACLLACMAGCGFRREEFSSLKWTHYQSREGRMCFVDFLGKGNKRRTVPVPVWAQVYIDRWKHSIENDERPGYRNHLEKLEHHKFEPEYVGGGLRHDHIYMIIVTYGERAGYHLAPHDLRRTLAQLLRKAGAPLEQIQYTLGHEDVSTTMEYLGSKLELAPGVAAVDAIELGGAR